MQIRLSRRLGDRRALFDAENVVLMFLLFCFLLGMLGGCCHQADPFPGSNYRRVVAVPDDHGFRPKGTGALAGAEPESAVADAGVAGK